MEPSRSPGEDPAQSPELSRDELSQTQLPPASLRIPFTSRHSEDGYAQILLDQQNLPERIDLVDRKESLRLSSWTGFAVSINEPALQSVFDWNLISRKPSDLLESLVTALQSANHLAQELKLTPPQVVRHSGIPHTSSPRPLACGDSIEYTHSVLPASIEEWASGHKRHETTAIRRDSQGRELVSLFTSLLDFPDGTAIREVAITDHRPSLSSHTPYRFQHVSRTPEDLNVSNDTVFRIFMDLELDTVDSFLLPYRQENRLQIPVTEPPPTLSTNSRLEELHDLSTSGSLELESGALLRWRYGDQQSWINIFSSVDPDSSSISFTSVKNNITLKLFNHFLQAIASEEEPRLVETAESLISGNFSFHSRSNGDSSSRITLLTRGLTEQLASSVLVQRPASEAEFGAHNNFHDIIGGYEWIRFSDQRYLNCRRGDANRVATSMSLRVWQGGCDKIALEEQNGKYIFITPAGSHFFSGNIPQTRSFLQSQLNLFADNPIRLIEHHLNLGSEVTSIFGFKPDLDLTRRVSFLEHLIEQDATSPLKLFSSTSLKSLVLNTCRVTPTNTIKLLSDAPISLKVHLDEQGVSSLSFHRKNTMWEWLQMKGNETVSNFPVPAEIGTSPAAAYHLINEIYEELTLCIGDRSIYRVSEKDLAQLMTTIFGARLIQDPSSHSSESREHQQQGTTENMQARYPR